MTDRERILAFDRELMAVNEEKTFSYKFLYIIMSTLGCFITIFPIGAEDSRDMRVIYVLGWLFLSMAVMFRIQPYLYIFENSTRVREVLAYIPVDKALLRQVRRGYLRRYLIKLGAAALAFQQMGALIDGCWSVWNLIYPAVLICLLYLEGLAYIGKK